MIGHMKEHLGFTFRKGKVSNPENDKVCAECGKIVKSNMNDHLKRCNQIKLVDLTEYPCEYCRRIFKKEVNLINHMEINHGQGKRCKLALTEPGQNAKEDSVIKGTELEYETDNQPTYPCDYCRKKFKKEVNLQKHIENKHSTKNKVEALNTVVFEQFLEGEILVNVVADKRT